jgi:HEPN pEK499 p136
VKRTRENLDVTEDWREQHPHDGFNEVTHLINSLLGLVVVPTAAKRVLSSIDQAAVERTGIRKWGVVFDLQGKAPPTDVEGLVTGLRNAVSHYDVQYGDDSSHDITSVTFNVIPWSRNGPPPPRWSATFTIGELRSFLKRLADEVELFLGKESSQLATLD